MTRLAELVATSAAVRASRGRRAKAERLAVYLKDLPGEEIELAVNYLVGTLRQGRIGIGPAAVRDSAGIPAAADALLLLSEVDRCFNDIAVIRGARSQTRRGDALARLLVRATPPEQAFIRRLILGELRQGAVEGLMLDAVVAATQVSPERLRRAAMLSADLAKVARVAFADGDTGLGRFQLRLLQPVKPMLAQPQKSVAEALAALGEAAFEYKMDGVRVQVHKSAGEVRVFSRQLNDITAQLPEVVETVAEIAAACDLILDGEVLALLDGQPQAFQVTMRRFGRRRDIARQRASLPLSAFYFDCLLVDDEALIDRPWHNRRAALEQAVAPAARMPVLVTGDAAAAQRMLDMALGAGHEGVMAKAVDAAYEAGARGGNWLKVKPVHTLDLVVLGVEWGSGRRRGWLSNLHLGARDPEHGKYIMVGKTFKGLTDAMLKEQTRRLLALERGREGAIVWVRPELVVEVAFGAVQTSHQYPGGVALRFARVRRYREDKHADQADTIDRVREFRDAGGSST